MNPARILIAAISGLTIGFLLGALASSFAPPQPVSFFDPAAHDAP